jgi:ADP-ribose pyrophosphatase
MGGLTAGPLVSVAGSIGIDIPDGFQVRAGNPPRIARGRYVQLQAQEYETEDTVNGVQGNQMREFVALRKMAVAVLPMCPREGKYLLIRQFRYPAYHNAVNNQHLSGKVEVEDGWLYETIAGVIEPSDTPEETAIRECLEEGNCVITDKDIRKVDFCFMTPGLTNEEMHIFLGIVDTTTDGTATTGLATETELIRAKWMTADEIRALHAKGLLKDAKTLLALYAARVL